MHIYMLRSYGPDDNEEHWLMRDEAVDDFEALVDDVAGDISKAESMNLGDRRRANRMPWWGQIVDAVVDALCSDHGFERVEPDGVYARSWSEPCSDFCSRSDP